MKRFEIEMSRGEKAEVFLYADSPEQAVDLARKENPGFSVEFVNGELYLGRCESCRKVITESVESAADEDGVRVCMDCAVLIDAEQ